MKRGCSQLLICFHQTLMGSRLCSSQTFQSLLLIFRQKSTSAMSAPSRKLRPPHRRPAQRNVWSTTLQVGYERKKWCLCLIVLTFTRTDSCTAPLMPLQWNNPSALTRRLPWTREFQPNFKKTKSQIISAYDSFVTNKLNKVIYLLTYLKF